MKVTLWTIADIKTGYIKFNHIENGWSEGEKPLPIKPEFTNQLAWQNHTWIKNYKYLVDGKICPIMP